MRIGEGSVIFVTGGASGLGEATVRDMYALGASIAVVDQDDEKMRALYAELGSSERILCIKCDVTKEEEVKNAIDRTVEKFGTIHAALACAGVAWPAPMLSRQGPLDTDSFRSVIQINLLGSVFVAKYAAVVMAKNKPLNDQGEKGVIMFVSSVAAEEATRA